MGSRGIVAGRILTGGATASSPPPSPSPHTVIGDFVTLLLKYWLMSLLNALLSLCFYMKCPYFVLS